MQGHDIILIGTSAGGLKALTAVMRELPADLEAALFVIQHLSPNRPSYLPRILRDVGPLPASHARDGERIRNGHIYIAPPDFHLLINRNHMRLLRGPQENRFRPSVDTSFRSAARAYGSRVVGVILTGSLDDGTVGLQAIKHYGGVTAIQDPMEAEYPSMPRSAALFARPDYTLSLAELPDFLVRMATEPAADRAGIPLSKEVEVEAAIAEQHMDGRDLLSSVESIGTRMPYTCPMCNGSIWQVGEAEPLRFRCHVGHAFTAEAFLAAQDQHLENAIWSALRLLEERAALYRQLAARRAGSGQRDAEKEYRDLAGEADDHVQALRRLLLTGFEAKRPEPEEEPQPTPSAALEEH